MNIEKFTTHAKSTIANAQSLAAASDHQQVLPLHILAALIEDNTGIITNLINIVGANLENLNYSLTTELNKIPKVQVAGGSQLYLSSEAVKLLDKATKLAKDNSDNFVTIERIFEALTYDNTQGGKILAENAITSKNIGAAILQLRKGKKADSESAENSYDALRKYGRDVTELAELGKLDPIIGRDEEIRRTIQVLSRSRRITRC